MPIFMRTQLGPLSALGLCLPWPFCALFQRPRSPISNVIVGNGTHAFRWTAAGGMVNLAGGSSGAEFLSTDGSVVVGWIKLPFGVHAFRWTARDGMVDLEALNGVNSTAHAMSESTTDAEAEYRLLAADSAPPDRFSTGVGRRRYSNPS
jgi:hypothetical protein